MIERLERLTTVDELREENADLRRRVAELEETLEVVTAIRNGQVDAVIVGGDDETPQVWSLESVEQIHLRLAQQAANAGTWELNLLERRLRGSASFWSLLGVAATTQDMAAERVWARWVHSEDRERLRERLQGTLESDDDFYDELRIVRAAGEQRWLAVRGRVLRSAEGVPLKVLGISLDITERRAIEEALRVADRRKDEFLAMLAHELRNPLAAISNAFRLFRGVSLSESEREWTGEVLERQILQLQSLIDDLLDISRITQGKVELRKRTLDVTELVERVVETLRPRFAAAQQQLSIEIAGESLWVHGDESRLEQVLVNLLTNAAKYTKKGGQITLQAGAHEGNVVIRVRDTGIGIPPEMLPRVFDLFAQAERGLERTEGGLGIGLTLVRRIVDLHEGTVTAHSEGSGRGSEFEVRLPAGSPHKTPAGGNDGSAHETPSEARRVLIVDDNRDAAATMALLLKLAGHETSTAHDGKEALALLGELRPDVALLDIGLPEMDGYELAQRIRAELPDVALVAVSGYGQPEDRARSREAGFDEHFVKPVDSEQLLGLIGRAR